MLLHLCLVYLHLTLIAGLSIKNCGVEWGKSLARRSLSAVLVVVMTEQFYSSVFSASVFLLKRSK